METIKSAQPAKLKDRLTAQEAFEQAIECGRLSANPNDANYAGHYMYMGPAINVELSETTTVYRDLFKNINTREYIQ